MLIILYTKPQAPSVQFVTVFVANLFVYNVDNKLTKWSLSLTVHFRADNLQLSVCVAMCFKYCWQRLLPGDCTWRAVLYC